MIKTSIHESRYKSTTFNSLTEKNSTVSGEILSEFSETANSDNKLLKSFKKKGKWTYQEDETLEILIQQYGQKSWKKISEKINGRSPIQCLHRWTKILQPGLIKGPWTIEQDRKLLEWVKSQGPNNWSQCAEVLKGRSGKQCRERWYNTLNPNVKKGNWSPDEDFLVFDMYTKYGSQWTKIASHLPGRTENSIKNRFYSTLRRIASQLKDLGESISSSMIPKERLVEFVPDALLEKTMNFLEFKGVNTIDELSKLREDSNKLEEINEIDKKYGNNDEQMCILMKKSKLRNKILSKEDEEMGFDFEYNKLKETPTEILEYNIENLIEAEPFSETDCQRDFQISEFIQNFFDHKFEKEEFDIFPSNNQEIEENSTDLIVSQLDELEKILKETKSDLIKRSRRTLVNGIRLN